MALQKNKTIKGFIGNYWRIVQLNMNYDLQDAVMTVALYKDQTTRDADSSAVIHSFQYDLSNSFHDENYSDGADVMKNISLKECYKVLKDLAITEEAKTEDKNEDLAYFSDASDV